MFATVTGALAKRAAPPVVPPLRAGAVEYRVPNDDGRHAYLQAWDFAASHMLWEVTVFTNTMDPHLEADVQHTYIKSLAMSGDALVVTDEKGRAYAIDPRSRRVSSRT